MNYVENRWQEVALLPYECLEERGRWRVGRIAGRGVVSYEKRGGGQAAPEAGKPVRNGGREWER
ncbi:MAG: hypothetical protein GTN65_18440 [Armatimonadetes bacterium]|nr:hypothetical protein [Armatimonadota bacterium]NIN07059.1 hypothetical protein [Armatimonadota bacterium]NIO99014.1 hypothetical protein [Armatimonadota bacterium]